MSRPVLPFARATVFATVCTCLGVLGHVWMSGRPVSLWAIVAGFLGVLCLARLLAARECSLAAITGLMAATQAGLHLLFASSQASHASHTSMAGMSSMGGMAGMSGMSGMPGMGHPAAPGSMASASTASMRMSAGMLAVHVVAALVCAWWMRVGEARLHRWVRVAAGWLARRWAPIAAAPAQACHVSRVVPMAQVVRASDAIRFAVLRRGPPQLSVPA